MLWSDPVDETAQERERVTARLRHVGVVIAVLALLLMIIVWL